MAFVGYRRFLLGTSGFDSDAQLFFQAAGITNPREQAAINFLVTAWKANGWWDKTAYLNPISQTSLNAALFELKTKTAGTTINTVTHSSSGVTFSSSAINTGFIPSSSIIANNTTNIGIYVTASPNGFSDFLGASDASANTWSIGRLSGTNQRALYYGRQLTPARTTDPGLHVLHVIASLQDYYFINGVQEASNTATPHSNNRPTVAVYLGARNNNGVLNNNSAITCGLLYMAQPFTNLEMPAVYSVVQQYQTLMGRAV